MTNGDRRLPRRRWWLAVTSGDTDDVDVVTCVQGARQLERGHRGATGNGMPALFEGDADTHVSSLLDAEARPECGDRALESLTQRDRRCPSQDLAGEREVGLTLGGIVDRQRLVHDLRAGPGELEHDLGQLEHGELAVVADVDRAGGVAVE